MDGGQLGEGYGNLYASLGWTDPGASSCTCVTFRWIGEFLEFMIALPRCVVYDLLGGDRILAVFRLKIELRDYKECAFVRKGSRLFLVLLKE